MAQQQRYTPVPGMGPSGNSFIGEFLTYNAPYQKYFEMRDGSRRV